SLESLWVDKDTDPFSVVCLSGVPLQQTRTRMARVKRILDGFMAILSFGTFHIDPSRYGNGSLLVDYSPGQPLETEMDVVLGPLMYRNTATEQDQGLIRGPV